MPIQPTAPPQPGASQFPSATYEALAPAAADDLTLLLPAVWASLRGARRWMHGAVVTPAGQMGFFGLLLLGVVALTVGSALGHLDLLALGGLCLLVVIGVLS